MIDNQTYIVRIVVPTLAAVIVSVTVALLWGLFDPRVNNDDIFKVIGPAFQTIVGVFAGFLGGYAVGKGASSPTEQGERDEVEGDPPRGASRLG